MNSNFLQSLEGLLRSPELLVEKLRDRSAQALLYRASLLVIVAGTMVFGAVLGSSHGLRQSCYSAVKLPAAFLLTLLLVSPALAAIASALRRPLDAAQSTLLVLSAAARASLVLLALAPVVWLALSRGMQYHRGIAVAVACYGLAGIAALKLVLRGLGSGWRARFIVLFFAVTLVPAGAQSAWMLRPFVGRPSQASVPFLRHLDGSFSDSVVRNAQSSLRYE
jgi:hypothetical protein